MMFLFNYNGVFNNIQYDEEDRETFMETLCFSDVVRTATDIIYKHSITDDNFLLSIINEEAGTNFQNYAELLNWSSKFESNDKNEKIANEVLEICEWRFGDELYDKYYIEAKDFFTNGYLLEKYQK